MWLLKEPVHLGILVDYLDRLLAAETDMTAENEAGTG